MSVGIAIFADFCEGPFGVSALDRRIGARTIIEHTLVRAAAIEGAAQRALVVRPRDAARARAAIAAAGVGERFTVLANDDGQRPRKGLIGAARKWGLASWRGTPLGTTYFDEYVDPHAVAAVLDEFKTSAALCVDGAMPLLDPRMASRMIAHFHEHQAEAPFVFTQLPPGLAGVLLSRDATRDLLANQWPFGLLLSYRPEAPRVDPITRAMCLATPPAAAQLAARFVGDTQRSLRLVSAAISACSETVGVEQLAAWARTHALNKQDDLPQEIELELTTRTPVAGARFRAPLGGQPRMLGDLRALERVARELAEADDAIVLLGGHGDPLAHPDFATICESLRAAGIATLGLVTPLVELSEAQLEALFAARIDAIEVSLNANSRRVYEALHGRDAFEQVLANIARIQAARKQRLQPAPIVIPSIVRCDATIDEVDPFFDRWIRETGWAVIRGFNDFAGRLAQDRLISTTPLLREPCRRLQRRLLLLADGRVARCEQDCDGAHALGRWDVDTLRSVWLGHELESLRAVHRANQGARLPLCDRCNEWHRQ